MSSADCPNGERPDQSVLTKFDVMYRICATSSPVFRVGDFENHTTTAARQTAEFGCPAGW
jgi:hypothetical protein